MEGTVNVDPAKLEVFMGKMIGHMTGSTLCYSIWLGDELGLYRELAGTGPRNADSVAAKTGCNARLVREWLDAQAAGGCERAAVHPHAAATTATPTVRCLDMVASIAEHSWSR